MKPSDMFCDHPDCPLRGQRGQGNIIGHGQKERRFRCTACGHTAAATQGTPFYRLRTPAERVTLVLALLGHG
jgi:transposase-like protein